MEFLLATSIKYSEIILHLYLLLFMGSAALVFISIELVFVETLQTRNLGVFPIHFNVMVLVHLASTVLNYYCHNKDF